MERSTGEKAFLAGCAALLTVGLVMLGVRYLPVGSEDPPVAAAVSAEPVASSEPAVEVTTPEEVPSPVEPSGSPTVVSESPTEEPSVEPGPAATGVAADGSEGTVLFRGGPATGPWQQLGTVAEITHPEAPATARFAYTNFWADPEEENQSDELWDQLVVDVTERVVELGRPMDRPAFDGAAGSEPFNSFGGVQDIYTASGVFTAVWTATFEDELGVAKAYFWYAIAFDETVVARSSEPFVLRDDGDRTVEQNSADQLSAHRQWAQGLGLVE